ncbi:MAG: hypothetical protein E5Y12_27385 [Mesorhizobium sp.]|nr:hypothetical protein X740_15715 [Mesorhizobium sp. LNHC221B00]TIN92478.1 MAG: hypothetical protein E5Y06_23510 [Mesorhizobium sp.]TJU93838.1 MAG: hypothetical protein E5Y12_27385 [Mesorhizobium sp.]TJU97924.1 MAG: hypothetical protein E5Y08_15425 [Mesorhizobium sp.]TJV15095.1 MAG: hypothetical protein E5Y07_24075 [Mesorhizobium sp.]
MTRRGALALFVLPLAATMVRPTDAMHAGENHMSILPVTVNRAVQAAFAVRQGNIAAAERLPR